MSVLSIQRALRDDRGSAIIAVVIIIFVMTVIGTAAVRTAMHSNDTTSLDRKRVQSIQAAEAGVNKAIDRLQQVVSCDGAVAAPESLTDGSRTIGTYRVRIDPESGDPTCTSDKRVIHAWGFDTDGGEKAMRHLEVAVELIPQDGFQFTLFASGPTGIVQVKNTGTVQGDIYAENLDQTKNNINADSVVTSGSIDTQNNAVYTGTLWAGGDVTLRQNGQVGESILAAGSTAAGDVTLENNVVIGRDVKAKNVVNLPTTYTVNGSISQGNPNLPPPPELVKPTFTYDPTNYTPSPSTYASAASATSYLESIKDDLQGTIYVNDPAGTVVLPRNANITGPLTVITNGALELGRTYAASGGPWQVALISTKSSGIAIDAPQPTTFSAGLDVLMYAEGEVDLKNQLTMTGAIYADVILLKNAVQVTRSQSLADNPPAGFDFTQASASNFLIVPVLWREIVPGPPPA